MTRAWAQEVSRGPEAATRRWSFRLWDRSGSWRDVVDVEDGVETRRGGNRGYEAMFGKEFCG